MEDPTKRIRKIQEKINELKAQKISAEKYKTEVIEELHKYDINIIDIDEEIEKRIKQKDKLEKEINGYLEEAENVIKGT